MATAPVRLGGGNREQDQDQGDDFDVEVTREVVDRERRAAQAAARVEARAGKTRRSWYTETSAADAFQAAVDDIHHATRVPKHEVVAELLRAAVKAAPGVQKHLERKHR